MAFFTLLTTLYQQEVQPEDFVLSPVHQLQLSSRLELVPEAVKVEIWQLNKKQSLYTYRHVKISESHFQIFSSQQDKLDLNSQGSVHM